MGSNYRDAGVDYDVLDQAKRETLSLARQTSSYPNYIGAKVDESSFGESASLVDLGGQKLGFVIECLGTKSMIAKNYFDLSGEDRFFDIAYDAVAAVVNDLICVGALPVMVNAYFATGSADFYLEPYAGSLAKGWQAACSDAYAAWGGGESPTLAGLIEKDGVELAGSAIGKVPDDVLPLSGSRLEPGDEIVILSSSGMHTNGASLARKIASTLENSYLEQLPSGTSFGSALLEKSLIYVDIVRELMTETNILHYASHITGHGIRKIMRADRELTYRIAKLPDVPEVLRFMAECESMSDFDAYATLNMGAGFALYVKAGMGDTVCEVAASHGKEAVVAGIVEEGQKRIIVEPLDIVYDEKELLIR
ncbi:MAG: AIR synthase-related protein [Firmicutes bacterium]|nr:AIR synthase-related protein [Bacillota bacterium]